MTILITSDWHLGHLNIIKYCNRPFQTTEEMDAHIINNYNNTVTEKDIVYYLGDFSFTSKFDNLCYYFARLKKVKEFHYIRGNHDKLITKHWKDIPYITSFNDLKEIKPNNEDRVTLCHYAMRVWNKSHVGAYHLFGHSHGTLNNPEVNSMDVGVDCTNFKIFNWELIKSLIDVSTIMKKEHDRKASS